MPLRAIRAPPQPIACGDMAGLRLHVQQQRTTHQIRHPQNDQKPLCPTGIAAFRERMARQRRAKATELFYERDPGITVALVAKFIAPASSRELLIASNRASL